MPPSPNDTEDGRMSYEHIDVSRISGLTRELADDASACLRFIDDYIRGWEQRQARVAVAVERPVIDDALAALLSLSTSSAMVGADRLSSAAQALYSEARQLGTVPARGAERLGRIGLAVCEELRLATAGMREAA
jgi:hypothetical protein